MNTVNPANLKTGFAKLPDNYVRGVYKLVDGVCIYARGGYKLVDGVCIYARGVYKLVDGVCIYARGG